MRVSGSISESILDAVGETPLVRLKKMGRPLGADILIKMESLNPGGSHKARIAIGMIRAAEAKGILTRNAGQTIVEPTGGNTGIGLAMAAAVLGYNLVLVIPDNYSRDKQTLLRSYGATIILSESQRGNNSHGEKAMDLVMEHPDWILLNQGSNPANSEAHATATGPEILRQLGTLQVDHLIAGIGTGGHISAVGKLLKTRNPDLRVTGVQPDGCDIFTGIYRQHQIQGLAIGYTPANLALDMVNDLATVTEEEARQAMIQLMREEGLSVGPSTGANLAAVQKTVKPGERVVTFAYDSANDYLDFLQSSS